MALFDGLLGGGSADPYDLYGDILTEKQREALRARSSDQTWANAANFLAKAAMPTNKKIPLGGLLAGLAGAMGGSNQDEAVQTALKGALTTQQIAKLRREQKLLAELDPIQKELLRRQLALGGGGAPAVPTENQPSVQTVPPAAGPAPTATPPPGGAPLPSWSSSVPSQDLSQWGLPMRPRGGPLSATASEVSSEAPGPQSSLDPAASQGPLAMAGEDIWSQLASMQGGAAPGARPFDLASLGQGQGLPDLGQVQVEPLSGEARPAGRSWERDDPLIRKYESGNRNIMQGVVGPEGGYNPSVGRVTGPSSAGGYYQMIDPTWRGAAAKAGIDTKEYPRAIDAPFEVQQKVAKELYEDEGLRPWAPYNRNLAVATGYSGSLPNVGRVRIEPLGGEAAPAGGSGLIPGLGITPEALATLNSMYKAAGIDSPFGPLLETYYKSPDYLRQKALTEAGVLLETAPKIEAAKAKATQEYIQANEKFKSNLEIARDLVTKAGLVEQPDGTYKVIKDIQEGLAAVDNAKKTGDIKEYEYYVRNQEMRGQPALSQFDWDIARRKGGAASTILNTVEGQEAAGFKARLAVDQDMAKDANNKALIAAQLMPLLDQAMVIARTTPEGFAGPAYKTFGQIAGALGIAVPEGASNAELLGAINQRMIPMVREPGATAASEMDKYLAAGPALMNTADGRVKIIEMTKAINQRAIDVAKVIRNNMGAPDLHDKLRALDTPVFTEDQRAAMDAALKAGQAPAAPGAPRTRRWNPLTEQVE